MYLQNNYHFFSQSTQWVKEQLSFSVTNQQKKILTIVSCVLTCMIGFYAWTSFVLKNRKKFTQHDTPQKGLDKVIKQIAKEDLLKVKNEELQILQSDVQKDIKETSQQEITQKDPIENKDSKVEEILEEETCLTNSSQSPEEEKSKKPDSNEGIETDDRKIDDGKITYFSGVQFKGDFSKSLTGKGRKIFKGIREEIGNFNKGKLHGDGCIKYQDGMEAKGQFVSGDLNGQGMIVYPNMEKYEKGMFQNSELHGEGIRRFPGKVEKGIFKHGVLVQGKVYTKKEKSSNVN